MPPAYVREKKANKERILARKMRNKERRENVKKILLASVAVGEEIPGTADEKENKPARKRERPGPNIQGWKLDENNEPVRIVPATA